MTCTLSSDKTCEGLPKSQSVFLTSGLPVLEVQPVWEADKGLRRPRVQYRVLTFLTNRVLCTLYAMFTKLGRYFIAGIFLATISLTWGFAEVLSIAHMLVWPEPFSVSPLCVSLVIAKGWEEVFFCPITPSYMYLNHSKEASTLGQAQVKESKVELFTKNGEKTGSCVRRSLSCNQICSHLFL
jgi:hypothetical protein